MRSCSFSEAGVVVTARFGLMTGGEFGIAAVWKRPISPQAASDAAARSSADAAQNRWLIPFLRRPVSESTSATLFESTGARSRAPAFLEHGFPPKADARFSGSYRVSSHSELQSALFAPPRSVDRGGPRHSHELEFAGFPVT